MRTSNRAAADIERGTNELFDAQRLRPNRRTHDVHDGIGRADFVEVNFFDGHVVDLRLRRAQREEYLACGLLGRSLIPAAAMMPRISLSMRADAM